jgi:tRNA threonylcarbamoyl adenosine modification protein YjeE
MTVERATIDDLGGLERFARTFAQTLRPGDVVALAGDLGAGKTTLVRALVRTLHGSDPATSPTFTFWHKYDEGTPPIHHLDLYRLENPRERVELGLEEAFVPEAIVLVEWPERAPDLFGERTIWVSLAGSGEGRREIEVRRP